MAKVNLTTQRLNTFNCEPGKSQSFLWDATAPGLALRVTTKGDKAYIFQAKLHGKDIRITIGSMAAWRLQLAREKANGLRVMIDNGIDPREVKAAHVAMVQAAEVEDKRKSITFSEVWAAYLADRKASWGERHYRDHIAKSAPGGMVSCRGTSGRGVTIAGPLAYFMPLPMNTIDKKTVEAWSEKEGQERPTSARLALRLLKAFMQWCSEHDDYSNLLPTPNPAQTKKIRQNLGKVAAKRDHLGQAQLQGWFAAVRQVENRTISTYLQLLLLTGARPGELLGLQWDMINFQWNKIEIRDKIEGTRIIPLTPFVRHLLESLPRQNAYVFASTVAGVNTISTPNHLHSKACNTAGIANLTLHGLRRTFATLAECLDTPGGVAAQIQGHKPQGVRERHYIVRSLDVMRTWHVKIEAWILEQAKIEWTPQPN